MIDSPNRGAVRQKSAVYFWVRETFGVGGEPTTQNEYDCCLGSLFHLFTTFAMDDQIAEYLWLQDTEHMELRLQTEAMDPSCGTRRIPLRKLPNTCTALLQQGFRDVGPGVVGLRAPGRCSPIRPMPLQRRT
jgi:hypothetical protein